MLGSVGARDLSRLVQGLGVIGLAVVLATATVAFDAAAFHDPPRALRLAASVLGVLSMASLGRGLFAGVRVVAAANARMGRAKLDGGRVHGRQVVLLDRLQPVACCVGLLRPRVMLSTGAVARLSEEELRAVLVHEEAHSGRRDPLRLTLALVTSRMLAFLPGAPQLRRSYAELLEVAADEQASRRVGSAPLAGALVAFAEHGGPTPSAARVDALLGRRVGIDLRALLLDAGVLGALVLATFLLASVTGCVSLLGGAASCSSESFSGVAAVGMLGAAALLGCLAVLRSPALASYAG